MNWVTAGPAASLWATVILCGVTATCLFAGFRILGWLKVSMDALSKSEQRLFSVMTGFCFLSLGLLLLGIASWLTAAGFWLLLLLFVAMAFMGRTLLKSRAVTAAEAGGIGPRWIFLCQLWIIVVLILSWLQALAPPIGGDALSYHLYHPRIFLEQHRLFFIPLTRESLWPYLTEVFFMLGLFLQGTTLAQLFHWIFYPLTALAIYLYTQRFYGKTAAKLAALFFFLCPMGYAQSGHCYVDLSLAFFTFLVFYGLSLREIVGERSAVWLSGLAAGGTTATKYLGLSSAVTAAGFWLVRSKNKISSLFLFLIAISVISALWYVRSWVSSGNPVYPFFPHLFGSGLDFDISEGAGFSKGVVDFLKFGWDIAMYPRVFGGEVLGAQYLLFLPFLLTQIKKSQKVSREMALFTLIYTFLLFKQSQYARFYLSVIPFLSVGCGVAFVDILKNGHRWLKRVAVGALLVLMVLHGAINLYRLRNMWPVILGQQSGLDYLLKYERSHRGFLYIKEHAKPGDKVLNAGDIRHFYSEFQGTVMYTLFLNNELKAQGKTVSAYLEERQFDYIWQQDDPAIAAYVKKQNYQPIFSYDFTEGPKTWHFTIYESPSHRQVSQEA